MNCLHCGYAYHDGAIFCVNCGQKVRTNPIIYALRHPLFLVLCILVSAGAALGAMKSDISPIRVLMVIFLWLCFAKARKNSVPTAQLRQISGTFFASYVANYIAAGTCILFGSLFLIFPMLGMYGFVNDLLQEFGASVYTFHDSLAVFYVLFAIAGIMFLVLGIGLLIMNLLGYRRIHRFLQVLYQNAEAPAALTLNVKNIRGWMIAIGVFSIVVSLGSGFWNWLSWFSGFCDGAAWIVCSILLRKSESCA